MSNSISWFQDNWLEATMLLATIIAVVATVIAVRVAVLALKVARRSAQSADEAHVRSVRLQARAALAEARGSFQKLASACHVNQEKWRQHQMANGPVFGVNPFAPTQEMREVSTLKNRASEVLRLATEKLQSIDEMALDDLENAIPRVRQSVSEIEALAQHLQEPNRAFR